MSKSSQFMSDILSGDPTKISQALAPQISAAKTSAQQSNKTTAEFGTRSGGNTASNATTNDRTHADIADMVAKLTGSSVSGLSSTGSGLLSTGMSGTQTAFGDATTLQKERAAKLNDIIGSSASVAGGFLGALPAGAGSIADTAGNFLSGVA